MTMLFNFYLRKGQVFVPTVAKTEAGFFMDLNPVSVVEVGNPDAVAQAIVATIEKRNPIVPTPTRGTFPTPVILAHAKVKSWATFEKSALCIKVVLNGSIYQIRPMRKSPSGGWEDDPARIESLPVGAAPKDVARRVVELLTGLAT
jgi:hypothetical protein